MIWSCLPYETNLKLFLYEANMKLYLYEVSDVRSMSLMVSFHCYKSFSSVEFELTLLTKALWGCDLCLGLCFCACSVFTRECPSWMMNKRDSCVGAWTQAFCSQDWRGTALWFVGVDGCRNVCVCVCVCVCASLSNSKYWFTTSFLQPLPYLVLP